MRLYMVRRTRSFIIQNYAEEDPKQAGASCCSQMVKVIFPKRIPKTIGFRINESDPDDQYVLVSTRQMWSMQSIT